MLALAKSRMQDSSRRLTCFASPVKVADVDFFTATNPGRTPEAHGLLDKASHAQAPVRRPLIHSGLCLLPNAFVPERFSGFAPFTSRRCRNFCRREWPVGTCRTDGFPHTDRHAAPDVLPRPHGLLYLLLLQGNGDLRTHSKSNAKAPHGSAHGVLLGVAHGCNVLSHAPGSRYTAAESTTLDEYPVSVPLLVGCVCSRNSAR